MHLHLILYHNYLAAYSRQYWQTKSKSTAGINNINTVELGSSIISLPPLEEQKEIVRRLDKLLEENLGLILGR